MLGALRVDGVITSEQMNDLFAYIDQLGKRGCIYFEVSLTKEAEFVLSDIDVKSPMSEVMAEVMRDLLFEIAKTPSCAMYKVILVVLKN